MTSPNDDLTPFQYPPLNALPSEYDLNMQQPLGDAPYNDSVEMFMDPQFWTMDNQSFSAFDMADLANTSEHKLTTPMLKAGNQSAPFYQADLASPASSVASPSAITASPKASRAPPLKHEDAAKKSGSVESAATADSDQTALDVSAEEDKRRRNTAASARFRVKKKQREQAMEKTAKDMTDKCTALENRVKDLEKENQLLKGLLTEKASGRGKHAESSSSEEEVPSTRASKRARIAEAAR